MKTLDLLQQALEIVNGRPIYSRELLEKFILAAIYTLEAEEAMRGLELDNTEPPTERT